MLKGSLTVGHLNLMLLAKMQKHLVVVGSSACDVAAIKWSTGLSNTPKRGNYRGGKCCARGPFAPSPHVYLRAYSYHGKGTAALCFGRIRTRLEVIQVPSFSVVG